MQSLAASDIAIRAQDHLRCLIYGLDPRTQGPLADIAALTDPSVMRSLIFALEVLEQKQEISFPEKEKGRRAGAPWNSTEDKRLLDQFRSGAKLMDLVLFHERGEGGILSRLARLNAVSSRKEARGIFYRRQAMGTKEH